MNKNSNNRLVVVAGGSGGHILPALSLAKKWKDKNKSGKIVFLNSSKKIDSQILSDKTFISRSITLWIDKLPSKILLPYFALQATVSFFQSFLILLFFRPQKVVTTGGLIAIPVCFAAKILGINIELYELNATPGKASLVIARLASNILVTFQGCKKHFESLLSPGAKLGLETYPTRFSKNDLICDKNQAIASINENIKDNNFKFSNKRKTIFILGGSQGSEYLNNIFKSWLEANKNIASKIQIIHQIGSSTNEEFSFLYTSLLIPHFNFSYDENIKNFYLISDLVISRAGAGTLFELEFFKKKALIIPLITNANDHQVNNAQEMAKKYPELFLMHKQVSAQKDLEFISSSIKKILNF